MASALTVLLLGCWLAGHSGVWGEPSYPKPSIFGIPSKGVSLGESVSIWCKGQRESVQFVLNKDGRHIQSVDSDLLALFPINNVSREDGGNYNCSYHSRSEPFAVSDPSDPVELVVRDPSLPRPNISLSPTGVMAPGADVTVRCQGQLRDVRFFLYKAGDLNPQQHMDPAGAGAEFRIPSLGRQQEGNYSCSYRPRSEPFVSSQPSDTVKLVVAEPSYPKPSISLLSPSSKVSLRGAVSVRCSGQRQGMRFVLNKEGRHFPPVDSDGSEVVFHISNMSREDGGNYSCSYHSRSEPFAMSYPSDPMELVVTDPSLPRPNISLSPTGVTAPGADVTIRCQGQLRDVRFFLHKAGDLNPQGQMDPAGDRAEFRIPTVGRQHGGSYSCSYRPRSEPFVSSEPSEIVQLVVVEPSYPKPNISGIPSGGVSLGAAVTIWCWGQHPGVRFVLNKEGRHYPPVDSDRFEAEFLISNVSREDGGNYSCSYHSKSKPFAVSYPSDPVELVVRGAWIWPRKEANILGDKLLSHGVLRRQHNPPPRPQTPLPRRILPHNSF
ncbi:immunoglobulin superfamily member 1-like isoform X2 [Gopherus flavomarginatus]|uniref:immunoglobulin superfamily member 1-like isoform X2 n=1 Tax=Gopherus flavomarginatus TaxID=286002 RepID=UPI0021CC31A3|nr:immunoglobulin superfamily member 1-like isoform X2 [Gopherus flavomarginatus]